MSDLLIHIFNVGNSDCILVELPYKSHNIVDFYQSKLLQDHPLYPSVSDKVKNTDFICLTHPHKDHMLGMDKVIEYAYRKDTQFWHTITDAYQVLQLWTTAIDNIDSKRKIHDEVIGLVQILKTVSEKYPKSHIRFMSADNSRNVYNNEDIEISVLGPTINEASNYINMLKKLNESTIKDVDDRIINEMSLTLRIKNGDNSIILSGDATKRNWLRITGRKNEKNPFPQRIQAVKASHHGSDDSYYPELWDDLFGTDPGIILVSADGSIRPTKSFLDSFQTRIDRGINDQIYCTGPIDPHKRPEFLDLSYQIGYDYFSYNVANQGIVKFGNITVRIPFRGQITVEQPFSIPI
jgi:ribonuclease BN (tRNA processing enzyme)